MKSSDFFAAAFALLVGCLAAMGCSGGKPPAAPAAQSKHDDHDHDHGHDGDHPHPKTLAAGVAALKKATAELREALARDKVDAEDADEAVHEMGHLLEDLRTLAGKAGLGAEASAVATKALDDLEDGFGKVDEAFHAGDDKAEPPAKVLASVAERIDAAIKALEELK